MVNDGFTWMECCTKVCHKTGKTIIYKTTNGEMVQKRHAFFRVAPVPLLLFILLLIVVADLDSDDVIGNGGEKNNFTLFLS